MGISRYSASIDTTISNAFKMDLRTRATGSNMGLADTLEVFSIYGQAGTSSVTSSELSRILIQFPIQNIAADREDGEIPTSGNVSFFLKMFNAEHPFTVPKVFDLNVLAISRSWEEGYGLDMDEYTDLTYNNVGSNWINASSGSNNWTTAGGDFYTDTSSSFTASFITGVEDLEIDVSPLVEQWLSSSTAQSPTDDANLGSKTNYGFGIKFFDAEEGSSRSYYTKKFFARDSEFFLKRPVIEVRWDSTVKDNTGNFVLSSSLASAAQNLNKIYIYNNIRGQLRDIPGIGEDDRGEILVSIYSGSADNTSPTGSKLFLPAGGDVTSTGDVNITGGYAGSTGIYSASFAYISSSITTIFPVWHSGGVEYHTGSAITVNTLDSFDYNPYSTYVCKITNLQDVHYRTGDITRFRLYVREKDWNPNIYTKASTDIDTTIIEDAYYRVYRTVDDFEVVAYGTGSTNHTRLSYDKSGSYFDFPVDILAPGFMYAFQFAFLMPDGNYKQQPQVFKFRVE